jgi:alpha-galactosidase
MRALRNIPVMLSIAHDMEELCPDAWLLNITNPMTVLCRAVTRETSIATVGLCHEVTMAQSTVAQLLDVDFDAIDPTVTGVNHLPLVTALTVDGADGFELLRALLADDARRAEKHDVLRRNRVKVALFERFGVWPAAGDRHLVEFFPGFLTEESEWGRRWGVRLTTIEEREQWLDYFRAEFATLRGATEVPTTPSGEMVAPLLDAFLRDEPRAFPLNLPNPGRCPDIAPGPVVEAMCIADGSGIRGRDTATAPPLLAEWLRRIVASQDATVAAALSGNRDRVVDAMLLDPLAGRIDFERLEQMTDDMLATTAPWLPQFS